MENTAIYNKTTKDNLAPLKKLSEWKPFVEAFNAFDHEIRLTALEFEEAFTSLVTSSFFNSRNYLKQVTNEKFLRKHILNFDQLNQAMERNFQQLLSSLDGIQHQVLDETGLAEHLSKWKVQAYTEYYKTLQGYALKRGLLDLLKLLVKCYDTKMNVALFEQELTMVHYNFNKTLRMSTSEILSSLLTQIYARYGVNPTPRGHNFEHKKEAFADFTSVNLIMVSDVPSALSFFGLGDNATLSEVKKAYKTYAKRYHPDSHSPEASSEKMEQINFAYNLLKNHYALK